MPDEDAHAVRWITSFKGKVFEQYSKWHWTANANRTLCGRIIPLIKFDKLPEANDMVERVDCTVCRNRLSN